MEMTSVLDRYLPLTETTYYILLALTEPLHGYAVMQKVDELSAGAVKLGPGTLYGAFSQLEKANFIILVCEEERRKQYALTEHGVQLLLAQLERLKVMVVQGETLTQTFQLNQLHGKV